MLSCDRNFRQKMLPIKKDIKLVRSLQQKKFRREHQLFLVEGKKMVEEALASQWEIHSWYSTDPSVLEKHQGGFQVTAKEMEMMSALNTPSTHLAVLHSFNHPLALPDQGMVLLLDGISDPGNLGTILRTAEWFGISKVYCSEDTVELFNPKVVQSTMGSIFRVSLFYTDLHQIIEEIKAKQGSVYGADLEGENAFACKFNNLSALVIGSESHGIRPDIESLLSQKIFIPGAGKAESLNAGIAAGILMGQWFSTTKAS